MANDNDPIELPFEFEIEMAFSTEDLASWGVSEVAYVKPITVGSHREFGIFGADGTQLGAERDHEHAVAAAIAFDLMPVSLH